MGLFLGFYYVPLIYTCILQISLQFDYYSFVVLSEVLEGYASCFLFSRITSCNSGSFVALGVKNFRIISSSSVENVMDNLLEITLNLQTALNYMVILTILILPNPKFPDGPRLRLYASELLGTWVLSLIGELGSRMPRGATKKNTKRLQLILEVQEHGSYLSISL